jgi:hypothetical protein
MSVCLRLDLHIHNMLLEARNLQNESTVCTEIANGTPPIAMSIFPQFAICLLDSTQRGSRMQLDWQVIRGPNKLNVIYSEIMIKVLIEVLGAWTASTHIMLARIGNGFAMCIALSAFGRRRFKIYKRSHNLVVHDSFVPFNGYPILADLTFRLNSD